VTVAATTAATMSRAVYVFITRSIPVDRDYRLCGTLEVAFEVAYVSVMPLVASRIMLIPAFEHDPPGWLL
jgi:hypothetical protein